MLRGFYLVQKIKIILPWVGLLMNMMLGTFAMTKLEASYNILPFILGFITFICMFIFVANRSQITNQIQMLIIGKDKT
jgi:hypothetical protein